MSVLGTVSMCVGILLVLAVTIIIHELGHLCGGLATGYRLVTVRLLGLTVFRQSGSWAISLRSGRLPLAAQCLMAPRRDDDSFSYRLHLAGGFLGNFAVGLGGLVSLLTLDPSPPAETLLIALVAANIIGGLTQAIPLSKEVPNDGWNLFEASRGANGARDLRRVLVINGLLADGIRLRDIPESLFAPFPGVPDTGNAWMLVIYRADRLNDLGMRRRASEVFSSVRVEDLSGFQAGYVLSEITYNNVVHGIDSEPLADLKEPVVQRYLRLKLPSSLRVRAALAGLRDSDTDTAQAMLKEARRRLPAIGVAGGIQSERDEIDHLETVLRMQAGGKL